MWPTLGNHDADTADSPTQSGNYYNIFSLPTRGESGGVASGTEAYYSFDYGNIHFISLDSHDTNRSANGAMATWLTSDLAATDKEWIIAYWHHPPYSKGSHDSDTEQRLTDMRSRFLPILEAYAVDLVLAGHSHSYERSMLIDGHYGTSDTFNTSHLLDSGDGNPAGNGIYIKSAGSNSGAVYSVAGSSGKISSAPLDHPVMVSNLVDYGSMVIDVEGKQLDAIFLDADARIRDRFRIVHRSSGADNDPIWIGTATLDHDRINGPRWTRVDVNPQATGVHTLELAWNNNADLRFTLFRTGPGTSNQAIARVDANSPATWTGMLDVSYQYYLGVWSAAGSARFTTTLAEREPNDSPVTVNIAEGRLDSTRTQAPRWQQLNFGSLRTGNHTIALDWDNHDADLRFRVKRSDGTDVNSTVRGTNPGTWSGWLAGNTPYYLGVWSTNGVTNFSASIK